MPPPEPTASDVGLRFLRSTDIAAVSPKTAVLTFRPLSNRAEETSLPLDPKNGAVAPNPATIPGRLVTSPTGPLCVELKNPSGLCAAR